MQSQTTSRPIVVPNNGPNLLLRAVYFILVGWWFSGIWAVVGWLLCVTVIGLPLGLYMLNRLPQVVTLKPARRDWVVTPTGRIVDVDVRQRPFLLRALYFVLVGWWLSAVWIVAAWALHASIIGMVLGFWMFDRVPAIITLARS
ncbi:MAG TPA: YccF domain-containing protein [Roseiflexaceae bacterium]|nr:YccF domain-containing protein [Roseiflexaceae bacterium]